MKGKNFHIFVKIDQIILFQIILPLNYLDSEGQPRGILTWIRIGKKSQEVGEIVNHSES